VKRHPGLVDEYRELQAALAQYGVTPYTLDLAYDLERALSRELEISLLDPEQLDAAFDRLHLQAYPDAKSRPARLTAGILIDPRE
jgi:hypothetical protein